MHTKTIRPGLTAAMTAGRALLAAGWRYDSTSPMADYTTIRTLLHPSGREINARTVDGGEQTDLTLTGLTLDQVAGAVTGAGLAAPVEPEPTEQAGIGVGDVGKCPRCGRQSRSYSRGCSSCGYGTSEQPTEPAYMSCPRECGVDVREHNSSSLVDGRCDTEPDYWLTLAADLRQAADRIATLAGTETRPAHVSLYILGSVVARDAERMVPLVDALAAAFDTTAGVSDERRGEHRAMAEVGAVKVCAYTFVPEAEDAEKAALRAELETLRAQLAAGGTR